MKNRGIQLSLLTAVISGVSIFANALFVSKTDPLVFAVVRNAVVVLMLTSVLFLFGHIRKVRSLSAKDWGTLLLIGAIGGGIPFALFFTGLKEIGALSGNILQKTLFLWVALLAVPFLKERISAIQAAGYFALFIGLFVIGGTAGVVMKTGSWLVLAATVLWAVENVIAKVALRRIHPSVVSWGRMLFGIPFLMAATVLTGKTGLLAHPQSFVFMPILVSSALLTLYVSTWYTALSLAPATLVSSVLVAAPVVTAILTSSILKKPVIGTQVVSLAVISIGVVLMIAEKVFPKKQTAVSV